MEKDEIYNDDLKSSCSHLISNEDEHSIIKKKNLKEKNTDIPKEKKKIFFDIKDHHSEKNEQIKNEYSRINNNDISQSNNYLLDITNPEIKKNNLNLANIENKDPNTKLNISPFLNNDKNNINIYKGFHELLNDDSLHYKKEEFKEENNLESNLYNFKNINKIILEDNYLNNYKNENKESNSEVNKNLFKELEKNIIQNKNLKSQNIIDINRIINNNNNYDLKNLKSSNLENTEANKSNLLNIMDLTAGLNKNNNDRFNSNLKEANDYSYFDNKLHDVSEIQNIVSGNLLENNFQNQKSNSYLNLNESNLRENTQIKNLDNSKINIINENNNISKINDTNLNERKTNYNNLTKSKVIENLAKSKNIKNFTSLIFNKKSIYTSLK